MAHHAYVEKIEGAVFRAVMGLPAPVQRKLAGKPVVRDGHTLSTESQLMLRMQKVIREPGVETLPLAEARAAIRRQARFAGGRQPIGSVDDLEVAGAEGPLSARLYVPRAQAPTAGTAGARSSPLLVFIHGGGMMYGDLEGYDAVCRFFAERAGVRVLAVDYRLAPEHPFPAGLEDCWAAYRWAVEHAEELGADPSRIGVGGDSAGAYLSATTAISAADAGVPCAFQLLVYPVTDMADRSDSRETFAEGFYLNRRFMDGSEAAYLTADDDRRDPRVSVLHTKTFPEGLAPAHVVTAGFDPLRDEGEAYARLLADAGVTVELKRYPGLIHSFMNLVGAGRESKAAVGEIADRLRVLAGADGR